MRILTERLKALILDWVGLKDDKFIQTIESAIAYLKKVLSDEEQGFITVYVLALIERIKPLLKNQENAVNLFAHKYIEVAELRKLQATLARFSEKISAKDLELACVEYKEEITKLKAAVREIIIDTEAKKLRDSIVNVATTLIQGIKIKLNNEGVAYTGGQQAPEVMERVNYHSSTIRALEKIIAGGNLSFIDIKKLLREAIDLIDDDSFVKYNDYLEKQVKQLVTANADYMFFDQRCVECIPQSIQEVIDKIGTKYPDIVPKLEELKQKTLFYPMTNLVNIIQVFDVAGPKSVEQIFSLNDQHLKELLVKFNRVQDMKAIILALLFLSIKLCFEDKKINFGKMYDKKDISYIEIANMEIALLKLLDWRVEVMQDEYARLHKIVVDEYSML